MKVTRGSITRLFREEGCGFILDQDGCELHFDRSGLNGVDISSLFLGEWVEYEVQYGFERLRAINVRPLRSKTIVRFD